MSAQLFHYLAWIVGLFALYAFLARGLFRATNAYRHAMLNIAQTIYESPLATDELKERVDHRLDGVHSALASWRHLYYLLRVLVTFPWIRPEAEAAMNEMPPQLRAPYRRLVHCRIIAVFGNSPAAAFLAALLIVLAYCFMASANVISSALDRRDNSGGHDGMLPVRRTK